MSLSAEELEVLHHMKKRPESIVSEGNKELLRKVKVSIVGSRRPNAYTKAMVYQLAAELSKRNVVVVSGGAMGVDALAHRGAGTHNTIVVLPCGIHHRYPAVNASLIDEIAKKGLVLSQFEADFKARPWSFVVRNELVVALSEVLVVAEAERGSGSMRSVDFAKEMQKPIFVLPHRLGESQGTNDLLASGEAEGIFDLEAFADRFGKNSQKTMDDDFLLFCRTNPTFEEAAKRFGDRLFEAEIEGSVMVKDGRIYLS